MQSSYSVIKNNNVIENGAKQIVTNDVSNNRLEIIVENDKDEIVKYKDIADNIINEARRKAEIILSKAYGDAAALEKKSYEKGYETGYNDGKVQGYNIGMNDARAQGEIIIKSAQDVLVSAKNEYEIYLNEKKEDIKKLIMNITEQVLKCKIQDVALIDKAILEELKISKNTQTFIIKCNSMYFTHYKSKTDEWKNMLPFNAEFFVIEDESIVPGMALIEKNNGKVQIGIDIGLENIKKALMEC